MDLFHEDKYADMRQVNPYYPFASQAEWELASFLLKSGLSRVAVDQFLKLQFVCDSESKDIRVGLIYIFFRFKILAYRSNLPKPSGIVPKYCLHSHLIHVSLIWETTCGGFLIPKMVFVGYRRRLILKALPREILSSTTEIQSFAFSILCRTHWFRTTFHFHHSNSTKALQRQ